VVVKLVREIGDVDVEGPRLCRGPCYLELAGGSPPGGVAFMPFDIICALTVEPPGPLKAAAS
jgi:hypothetical protein